MKSAQHAGYLHKKAQEWARQERIKHPLPKKKKVIIPLVLSLFLSACASTPYDWGPHMQDMVYRADYSSGDLVWYWGHSVDPACASYWESRAEDEYRTVTIYNNCIDLRGAGSSQPFDPSLFFPQRQSIDVYIQ